MDNNISLNQCREMHSTIYRKNGKFCFTMIMLILYVFFLYMCQETLLPKKIHSFVMYIFVLACFFSIFLLQRGNLCVSKYSIWYLEILCFSIISLVWAADVAGDTLYTMLTVFVITFCFIYTINTDEKLDLSLRAFVVSADVMGLLIVITGQVEIGDASERLGQSITGNANIFSALMMVAAVFAAWLTIYRERHIFGKLLSLTSFIFILFLMGLSGGRKTVIAVVLCLIYFIVFKDGRASLKIVKNIIISFVVLWLLYWIVTNIPILYESIGYRFEELLKMASGGNSGVSSDKVRERMIEIALEEWKNRPIFGHGLDTFKFYNQSQTGHFYYAHNNYVELLYDFGVVGFVMYYGFIVMVSYSLIKSKGGQRNYQTLGLGLIFVLLFFDIGGVSYYTVMTQIMLCIAYICSKFCKGYLGI